MDEIDLRIINSLIQNSRITLSQMSKDIDVPDATISNRLKKLEKDVIKQYTLLLDYDKIDLKITAIIIIQSESEKHKTLKKNYRILIMFQKFTVFLVNMTSLLRYGRIV